MMMKRSIDPMIVGIAAASILSNPGLVGRLFVESTSTVSETVDGRWLIDGVGFVGPCGALESEVAKTLFVVVLAVLNSVSVN